MMGRGKKTQMRGGCSICSSQKKVFKESKKRRLREKQSIGRYLNKEVEII